MPMETEPPSQVVAESMPQSSVEVVTPGAYNYISTLSKKMANGGLLLRVLQPIENDIRKLVD